ncbi:hypothetical protein AB4289_15420 [Vibrio cyclitrophicus]
MNLPILDSLPAIHVTILGIVGAFFSAFAIYAYQKLNDAQEKLDTAVKLSMDLCSANNVYILDSGNKFLTKDGSLNWNEAGKNTLMDAVYLSETNAVSSSEKVIGICNDLFILFSTIFRTYPFWDEKQRNVLVQDNEVLTRSYEIDSERIQEMQRIVGYMSWMWSINGHALLRLAEKGKECDKNNQLADRREWIKQQYPDLPPEKFEEVLRDFDQRHSYRETKYDEIFVEYFEKAHMVKEKVIPSLLEHDSTLTMYDQKFKIKETTLKVIKLVIFNLIFGVMVPLILLNLFVGVGVEGSNILMSSFEGYNFWLSLFEYLLLMATMLPYFLGFIFLYSKVKKELNFL